MPYLPPGMDLQVFEECFLSYGLLDTLNRQAIMIYQLMSGDMVLNSACLLLPPLLSHIDLLKKICFLCISQSFFSPCSLQMGRVPQQQKRTSGVRSL